MAVVLKKKVKNPGVVLKTKAERYGRLTVVLRGAGFKVYPSGQKRRLWKFRCDCGKLVEVPAARVRSGHTKSCGCLKRDAPTKGRAIWLSRFKHPRTFPDGRYRPERVSYMNMMARCYNPKSDQYANYGAIGVTVCDRWRGPDGYDNFVDDRGPRPEGKTLHRAPPDANYTPDTCTWASSIVQQNNRRNNRNLTLGEEIHTVAEWARILDMCPGTLYSRIRRGLSDEEVLTCPHRARINLTSANCLLVHGGETHTVAEWARIIGVSYDVLSGRVRRKWPVEAALALPAGSGFKDWKPCKDTE